MSLASHYYSNETLLPILKQLRQVGSKILDQAPEMPFTPYTIETETNSPLFLGLWEKEFDREIRAKFTQISQPLFNELNLAPPSLAQLGQSLSPKVSIIGAGSAGLLAAVALNKLGCKVEIFEARAKYESMLRPQNISFKEAEERLKPMLGETLYKQFFARAASMDGDSGKLRISIGAFQEVLTEELEKQQVPIYYERKLTLEDIKGLQADVILLTTGVHTADYFDIQSALQPQVFPEFTVFGHTALYIRATNEPHGYKRSEREGYHWRRDNVTIYDGKTVGYDLRRMIRNLEKYGDPHHVIPRLHELQSAPSVEYSFIFGNDTELFFEGLDTDPQYLIQDGRYQVTPMLSTNLIINFSGTPIVVLGDANGSPHPLAAIGTLKFIRNIQDFLPEYIFNYTYFQQLLAKTEQSNAAQALQELIKLNEDIYCLSAMKNIFQVFYNNILCGIYSQPR